MQLHRIGNTSDHQLAVLMEDLHLGVPLEAPSNPNEDGRARIIASVMTVTSIAVFTVTVRLYVRMKPPPQPQLGRKYGIISRETPQLTTRPRMHSEGGVIISSKTAERREG